MGIIDFTREPAGEQERELVAADRRERTASDRWRRGLAVATAAAGVYLAARRVHRRREEANFTRIEIEGASPSVDR